MSEVPMELYINKSTGKKLERESDIDLKEFGEALRDEKMSAIKLIGLYNHTEDRKQYKGKLKELADKFKKAHQKRCKYQRKVWQTDFIEDERIKFGGREQVLKLQVDDYKLPVDKYLLIIAQALQIADNILNK